MCVCARVCVRVVYVCVGGWVGAGGWVGVGVGVGRMENENVNHS